MAGTTVHIDVSQSGSAAADMKKLTDATNAQAKATAALTREQATLEAKNRAIRQSNEQLIREQMGGGIGAGVRGFGRIAGGSIGGMLLGAHALGSIAPAINAARDPTKDPYTRDQRTIEAIPIIGGAVKAIREFKEAVDGTTAAIAGLRMSAEMYAAQQSAVFANIGQQRTEWLHNERASNAAIANASAPLVGFQGIGINRSTLQGERDYERARQQTPLLMNQRSAQIGVDEAKRNVASIEKAEEALSKAIADQTDIKSGPAEKSDWFKTGGKKNSAQEWLENNSGKTKIGREKDMRSEFQRTTDLLAQQNQLIDLQKQKRDAMVDVAQKESALRKASLDIDKEKLGYLQQQEKRVRSAAAGYGSMNAAERLAAKQAAERLEKHGLDALSETQRGLLSRAGGGEMLGRAYENRAQQDPEFARFRERIGAGGDLKQIQQQQLQLETAITAKVQIDSGTLATDVAKAVKEGFESVLSELKMKIINEIDQQRQGIKIRNWFGAGSG